MVLRDMYGAGNAQQGSGLREGVCVVWWWLGQGGRGWLCGCVQVCVCGWYTRLWPCGRLNVRVRERCPACDSGKVGTLWHGTKGDMPRVPKAQVPRVEACGQGVNVCQASLWGPRPGHRLQATAWHCITHTQCATHVLFISVLKHVATTSGLVGCKGAQICNIHAFCKARAVA